MPDPVLDAMYAQSERFQARLLRSLATVKRALAVSRSPHIAFSTGKDSTAVCALVHTIDPSVPLTWCDDELEYPETVAMIDGIRAVAPNQLTIVQGHAEHAGWFRPWTDRPYWREPYPDALNIESRVEEWQVEYYDLTFVGLRKTESKARGRWLTEAGDLYTSREGDKRCNPIMDWTEDDVWGLIAHWGLAYNRAYDVLDEIGVHRQRQRVGPLPLTPRDHLLSGWPDLLDRLEARYGERW